MRHLLALTLFSWAMVGCGGSSTSPQTSEDNAESGTAASSANADSGSRGTPDTFHTPEAAYAAMRQAVEKKDWKAVAELFSPESQAMLAGMSVMSSGFATIGEDGQEDPKKAKELQELLSRHGIDLDAQEGEPTEEELAAGPEAMMMNMTKSTPDVPAFIAEINAWMEDNSDQGDGAFADMGDLKELTIDGDMATAMSETEFGQQPIEFRKTGDGWIIHLPIGGPPEMPTSDFDEPDDGTPGLGIFELGDRSTKLKHALAYRAKFFDDPCTVVMLTVRPVPEPLLQELKQMFAEDGNDELFFPRGTHLKLSFDDQGELVSLFGWAENHSINGTDGVEADVTIEGDRAHGKVTMSDPKEIFDTTYRFDAEFDATILPVAVE